MVVCIPHTKCTEHVHMIWYISNPPPAQLRTPNIKRTHNLMCTQELTFPHGSYSAHTLIVPRRFRPQANTSQSAITRIAAVLNTTTNRPEIIIRSAHFIWWPIGGVIRSFREASSVALMHSIMAALATRDHCINHRRRHKFLRLSDNRRSRGRNVTQLRVAPPRGLHYRSQLG